jgi:hypothetical protein
LDDYAGIRPLVADLISDGAKATVSETVRQTVETVRTLRGECPEGVSLPKLATALNLDKSVVSRRVAAAVKDHYLINQETQKGRVARLVLGEPLPEHVEVLPLVETLADALADDDRCTVAA